MTRRRTGDSWSEPVSELVERRRRFHELVAAALDELPEPFRSKLDNVQVVIEDTGAPGTLGLYHGVPQTERGSGYTWVLPDVITIYRLPIEARCRTPEQLEREVRRTVRHEIAHHFGISDDRLREIDRY
jgi:predicted Zn-dependent protease with MMP-like domain